jgi:hypothetical protein
MPDLNGGQTTLERSSVSLEFTSHIPLDHFIKEQEER